MSLDMRYDALVCDMVVLLQEAMIRFLTSKPTDIDKFKHYFNRCFEKMTSLESQFHQLKMKLTFQLSKLRQFCIHIPQQPSFKKNDAQPIKFKNTENNNQSRYQLQSKVTERSQQLMSIQQVTEGRPKRKRVQTAGSQRNRYTALSMYGRPATEKNDTIKERKVYQSKTINYQPNLQEERKPQFVKTNIQQVINRQRKGGQSKISELISSPSQTQSKRKSFYDDLQKSRGEDYYQPLGFNDIRVKSLFKKRTKSQQKWNKISRLL